MMSIGTALNAATTLVGATLPAGLVGERAPVRTIRDETEEVREESPPEGALLVAVEACLREAGYLSA